MSSVLSLYIYLTRVLLFVAVYHSLHVFWRVLCYVGLLLKGSEKVKEGQKIERKDDEDFVTEESWW